MMRCASAWFIGVSLLVGGNDSTGHFIVRVIHASRLGQIQERVSLDNNNNNTSSIGL
jgi:hypothetical protein